MRQRSLEEVVRRGLAPDEDVERHDLGRWRDLADEGAELRPVAMRDDDDANPSPGGRPDEARALTISRQASAFLSKLPRRR
jgi:hypothetical protein